jgi:hypothetical protein
MSTVVRPKIEMLWLSAANGGMQLELNTHINGMSCPLARIVADNDDESLWLELYAENQIVQLPLSMLKDAIESASNKVHSESWYDRMPSQDSPGA